MYLPLKLEVPIKWKKRTKSDREHRRKIFQPIKVTREPKSRASWKACAGDKIERRVRGKRRDEKCKKKYVCPEYSLCERERGRLIYRREILNYRERGMRSLKKKRRFNFKVRAHARESCRSPKVFSACFTAPPLVLLCARAIYSILRERNFFMKFQELARWEKSRRSRGPFIYSVYQWRRWVLEDH